MKTGRPPKPEAERADSHIHIRVTRSRKTTYVRAAGGEKLSAWIVRHLDAATKGFKHGR